MHFSLGCLALLFIAIAVGRLRTPKTIDTITLTVDSSSPIQTPAGFPVHERLLITTRNAGENYIHLHLVSVEIESDGEWIRDPNAVKESDYIGVAGARPNGTRKSVVEVPKNAERRRLVFLVREGAGMDPMGHIEIPLWISRLVLGKDITIRLWLGIRDMLCPPEELTLEIDGPAESP